MQSEDQLIQKLMISKQIMEKHNQMPRNTNGGGGLLPNSQSPEVMHYDAPPANYNLPQDMMTESKIPTQSYQPASQDRILTSKLPDEIKRLMIEHPISQPSTSSPTLSNDLVEKAARLMGNNNTKPIQEQTKPTNGGFGNISPNDLKSLIKETIKEVLSENGLITESEQKSNEVFTFKVGKHVFEGKVTKIKKIQ